MPIAKTIAILEEGRGSQWDPVFSQIMIDWVNEEIDVFRAELAAAEHV